MVRSLSAQRYHWSSLTLQITTMLISFGLLLHLEHLVTGVTLWQEEHRHEFLQLSFPRLVSCHLGLSASKTVGTLTRRLPFRYRIFEISRPSQCHFFDIRRSGSRGSQPQLVG
ncbi:hypothetical protein B0H19DRAFT_1110412 [Mycena capillaripes]|nr:hypothetical protein B0H19DRAFT_1110412 [Mycena capillaripes]